MLRLSLIFVLTALCGQSAWAYTPQFPLQQGWLGADTAGSIPLDGRHRSLWLFSDTYVRQDAGTNRHGAGLVNNSLAVTTWNNYTTNINYYIRGRDQGAMTSIFPSPGSDTNGAWWYWVMDGFEYNGKIYAFLDRNRRTGGTLFSFQGFATDLAVLDNVNAEPNPLLWPLTIQKDLIDSTNILVGLSAWTDTNAGYAFIWGNNTVTVAGWNYVYLQLFRLPLAGLDNAAANLQYYTTLGAWSNVAGSTMANAMSVMSDGSPDFSVRYHPDLGSYVEIQCDDGFPAAAIWERTSTSLTNGWPSGSGATTLVTFANEPVYYPWPAFFYAAKEHVEFYSPVSGQALLTYCDNSADSGTNSVTNTLNNNALYVPRPRWVSLAAAASNHPPNNVTITAPLSGQNFNGPAEIPVSVTASDSDLNDSIVLVNVFLDGALAASTGTAPFNVMLHSVGSGTHTIYAEAYDTVEAKSTSAPISISVAPFAVTNYSTQVLLDGPQYYWRFNEPGHNGTAYEYYNRLQGVYGSSTTNGAAGLAGAPYYGFEGTNTTVGINKSVSTAAAGCVTAPALNLNTNTATFVAWIYPNTSLANGAGIVYSQYSSDPVGLGFAGGSRVIPNQLAYTWNHTNTSTWLSRLYAPVKQWSFVALTISPTQAIVYLGTNGTLVSATNAVAHINELWDGPTEIGSAALSSTASMFDGSIDEVAVFNYTFSPAQVAGLYAAAMIGPPVSLGYQFDGTNLTLTWSHGTLLQAPTVSGPWTPVPGAAAPSFMTIPNGTAFYQVRQYP